MSNILNKKNFPTNSSHIFNIAIEDLRENNWNPNHQSDEDFSTLKNSLEDSGGNDAQPILVRIHPTEKNKYEVIDGAHRLRAMTEIGYKYILANVTEMDDRDARMATISMNKLRGEFDSNELAKLISELRTEFEVSEDDLTDLLGFSELDLQNYEALIDFDFSVELTEPEIIDDEVVSKISEGDTGDTCINIPVTEEQHLVISRAIRKMSVSNVQEMGNGKALYHICDLWLKQEPVKDTKLSAEIPDIELEILDF